MTFIDPEARAEKLLIGSGDGAPVIFRARERCRAGFFVGLHQHAGDDSFQVLAGERRFSLGGERKVSREGEIVFAPAGIFRPTNEFRARDGPPCRPRAAEGPALPARGVPLDQRRRRRWRRWNGRNSWTWPSR